VRSLQTEHVNGECTALVNYFVLENIIVFLLKKILFMLTRAGLVIVIFKCIDTYCKIKKKNLLIWFLISVDKMSAGLSYVDVIFEGLSTF
jgi:cytochrome c oxidase subunit IV